MHVGPQPTSTEAIALMRLVIQVQEPDKQKAVVEAFWNLPSDDMGVLAEEMSRTGLPGQEYKLAPLQRRGGPSFLIYYSPAFLRQLTPQHAKDGLRLLAEVYRRARSLWPLRPDEDIGDGDAVTVRVDQLKELKLFEIQSIYASGESWYARNACNACNACNEIQSIYASGESWCAASRT